jgi:hypothetical protein
VVRSLAVRIALLFAGGAGRSSGGIPLDPCGGLLRVPLGALCRIVLAQTIPRAIRTIL